MNLQPVLKAPFRVARAVWRAARGTEPAPPPPVPTRTAPPAPPEAAPAPEVAPAPAAPREPVSVHVEETPNPDALKFVCSQTVVARGSLALNSADEAAQHPFASRLFALPGVRTVFATKDFVTVTRQPDGPSWAELRPQIELVLSESVGT